MHVFILEGPTVDKTGILNEYFPNFPKPIYIYVWQQQIVQVTCASLVLSNKNNFGNMSENIKNGFEITLKPCLRPMYNNLQILNKTLIELRNTEKVLVNNICFND